MHENTNLHGLLNARRSLILLNRASKHADAALKEVEANAADGSKVVQIVCDLCDFQSVRIAAEKICSDYDHLAGLFLNAGIMAQKDQRTKDGFDRQMQANHLSGFLLTSLLFKLLENGAEYVSLMSPCLSPFPLTAPLPE